MVETNQLPVISPVGPIYKTVEAAEVLKVSARTVQRMIREGKLKSHKIGRSHRILGRDIAAFFSQQDSTPSATSPDDPDPR
jgi:excisionase family DNA binding protein